MSIIFRTGDNNIHRSYKRVSKTSDRCFLSWKANLLITLGCFVALGEPTLVRAMLANIEADMRSTNRSASIDGVVPTQMLHFLENPESLKSLAKKSCQRRKRHLS
jgi:hypothetical protein